MTTTYARTLATADAAILVTVADSCLAFRETYQTWGDAQFLRSTYRSE